MSALPTDSSDVVAELAARAHAAGGPIVVTGAGGFIGGHLLARLAAARAPLRCLASRQRRPDLAAAAEWVLADLSEPDGADAVGAASATVFHLAGMASLDAAEADPAAAVRANVVATQNVLEAARRAGARRVVLVSTAHVHARPWRLPIDETHPVAPASIYAASKLAAEVLALGYRHSFALPVTILRLFNVYGPGQTAATAVSTLVRQAVGGETLRLRDPTVERDFVYVDDVVEALVAAALSERACGEAFVIASGSAVALGEIARIVGELTGRSGLPPGTEAAAATPDRMFGNAAKARALLGWMPRTSLRRGLAATIEWWRGAADPSATA